MKTKNILWRGNALSIGVMTFAILLLSGCTGKEIYVWNMRDIVGLWLWAAIISIVVLWYLIDAVITAIRRALKGLSKSRQKHSPKP